jgi:hypothetical protein
MARMGRDMRKNGEDRERGGQDDAGHRVRGNRVATKRMSDRVTSDPMTDDAMINDPMTNDPISSEAMTGVRSPGTMTFLLFPGTGGGRQCISPRTPSRLP